MNVRFADKPAPSARKKPQHEMTGSEERLQRLRYMYNAMLANESTMTINKKVGEVVNRKMATLSKGNLSTRTDVSNLSVNEPVSRVMMARALGNVFSNQNNQSQSRTTVKALSSNTSSTRETEREKRVRLARSYGNTFSQKNVEKTLSQSKKNGSSKSGAIETEKGKRARLARTYGNQHSQVNLEKVKDQKLRQDFRRDREPSRPPTPHEEQPTRWSNKTATHEYGLYYTLKNRLSLLETQRDQMVRLYGIDAFLDEYTELLEDCWRFETTHSNVVKFATGKIGRVLKDFEKMKHTDNRLAKKKTKFVTPTDKQSTPGSKTRSSTSKSTDSNASEATLQDHLSDSDHVFTSQLTIRDLKPKYRLSDSVLSNPFKDNNNQQTTNKPAKAKHEVQKTTSKPLKASHHEDTLYEVKLYAVPQTTITYPHKVNHEVPKTTSKPDKANRQEENLSLPVHSKTGSVFMLETNMNHEEQPPQLDCSTDLVLPGQRKSSSSVYLDSSDALSTVGLDSALAGDTHPASVLSAIVQKYDIDEKKYDAMGTASTAVENILEEEKSIELANEILRKIVTNCVEGMMATTTRRLEIQAK